MSDECWSPDALLVWIYPI